MNNSKYNAREALNQMKLEIASELGIPNYDTIDKGNLTARENGRIGGEMTKRLTQSGKQKMKTSSTNSDIIAAGRHGENRSNMTNNNNAKHGDR